MARNWLDEFMTAALRRKDRREKRGDGSTPAPKHTHDAGHHAAGHDPSGFAAHAAHGTDATHRLALAQHQAGGTTSQAASADAANGGAFAAPRRADSVAQAAAAGTYNYTGYARFVTVSQTGMFDIKAYGAQGGNGNYSGGFSGMKEGYGAGGKGAEVGGDIELTQGEELKIVVGGAGAYGYAGGGGGGTFIEEVDGNGTYTPLLIAGGGGGGSVAQAGGAGSADQTGKGASGNFYGNAGGGGAGIHGSAQPAPTKYSGGSGYNEGGNYAGGSAGVNQASQSPGPARGGFGGGGGGASYGARRYSGGGGGGYTGGKGGGYTGAQGGSSLVASGFSNVVRNSGVQSGNGLVTITPASVSPTVPANAFIYDTSAGTDPKTTTEGADSDFGFSFTTTSASTLNMWNIAVDNPGNGTGPFVVSIYSNASNNTPGDQLSVLELAMDSSLPKGIVNLTGSGATVPSLNGIQDGPPVQFAAHTTYWLVLGNAENSYLAPVQDNASPGIGFANEYTYDSGASTSQSYNNGSNPLDGAIQVTVCFASGTLIRTTRGDVAIETLNVGDLAITASGQARPIRWIGKRSFDCAAHRDPAMVRPIRVAAGAFGGGRPNRDLLLSPHHAVAVSCLGEVLVPIRLLSNGTTIAQQDDVAEITYWHVELESHDVILANGLPAESYIDVGNRCDFEGEATLTLHPEFQSPALAGYCRPLVTGGALLAAIRAQLADVAGQAVVEPAAAPAIEPGLHLLVDGERIAPAVRGHRAAFVVPTGASDVRLVSPAWSPSDIDPASRDERRLGLMIESIAIDDLLGTVIDVALDDPALVSGFHPVESGPDGTWRWTDGDALLSAARLGSRTTPWVLRLTGQFAVPAREDTGTRLAA